MFCCCLESCRNSQISIEVRRDPLENPTNDKAGRCVEPAKPKETLEMEEMI